MDNAKNSGGDAIKTPSKWTIQNTAEASQLVVEDLIDNKNADKITKSQKLFKML